METSHFDLGQFGDMLLKADHFAQEYELLIVGHSGVALRLIAHDIRRIKTVLNYLESACSAAHMEVDEGQRTRNEHIKDWAV